VEINEPKMTVEYDDGSTAELNMKIQLRIWENIQAEEEIKTSRPTKKKRKPKRKGTKFFVRPVDSLVAEQLGVRAYKEHVLEKSLTKLNLSLGDRFIYFSIESKVYFAAATITGTLAKPTKKDLLTEQQIGASIFLFPVDVDARASKVESAVPVDGVEFDSHPDIRELLKNEDTYISITEDEFEALAELLTEATVDESDDDSQKDAGDDEDFEV
jgi:hypothetical protein